VFRCTSKNPEAAIETDLEEMMFHPAHCSIKPNIYVAINHRFKMYYLQLKVM